MNYTLRSELGQVFTPDSVADKMISLIKNKGRILEPSCGSGVFCDKLPADNLVAIEIDKSFSRPSVITMDFFDYPISEKFDTIIGNPPYIRYNNIPERIRSKLDMTIFNGRSNLYLFFIYKCIRHLNPGGELIFIVPREFIKLSSAASLNEYLYENGTITDFTELADTRVFRGANPSTVIFRFEKDNFSRKTNNKGSFGVINGQISFAPDNYNVRFSDIFFVKVGAVSGADRIFVDNAGSTEMITAKTVSSGLTEKVFYNVKCPETEKHKEELINRKIRHYDESNYFMWGRDYYASDKERLYVNCKTRNPNPFFYNPCKAYSGSVLAVFPKRDLTGRQCSDIAGRLNRVDWDKLGFMCGTRYLFSQKSLEDCMLPEEFGDLIENRKTVPT